MSLTLFTALFTSCNASNGASSSEADADEGEQGKLKIIATAFPQYDFSRQIAGDLADISLLLPPGAESHSFDPTPKDIIAIQNADLFIYVGGENDEWVEGILDSMGEEAPRTLRLIDCVETVTNVIIPGMEGDEHAGEIDDHVWTSPKNAIKITEAISDILCELNPENKTVFTENTESYTADLSALFDKFVEAVDTSARKVLLFADRFPFRYLTDDLGLSYYAAFPGCSTDTDASAQTVAFLIDEVRSQNLPVIFKIEQSSGSIAKIISEETGAKVLTLISCHNLTKDEFESGETYLSLMEKNLLALKEALS